jgi:hypothetical protein
VGFLKFSDINVLLRQCVQGKRLTENLAAYLNRGTRGCYIHLERCIGAENHRLAGRCLSLPPPLAAESMGQRRDEQNNLSTRLCHGGAYNGASLH